MEKILLICALSWGLVSSAQAVPIKLMPVEQEPSFSEAPYRGLYRGDTLEESSVEEMTRSVQAGSVVILGENHGLSEHQSQHMAVLSALRNRGLTVSVGMEFFNYTDQELVDSYRSGQLSEPDFLKKIKWGSPSFDYYRSQVLFPQENQKESVVALNMPRSVTSKITKGGMDALTPQDRALLPPQFTLGRDSYKERFSELMLPHLPNPNDLDKYFTSQSLWDDTMAWRVVEHVNSHPKDVLVIIVGDFHAQYGGGLPDRIRERSHSELPILVMSQVNSLDLTSEELKFEVEPSSKYGSRANYVWVADAKSDEAQIFSIKSGVKRKSINELKYMKINNSFEEELP